MTKAPPLRSWHAQRSAGSGGTRVFSREWRAHGDPLTAADDPATFTPLCMDADELADYRAGRIKACSDCLPKFALEMRALRRCNGHPGGVEIDPEDEEPETPARKEHRHMATLKVNVTAPCVTCVHAAVCARRESIIALQQGDLAVEHSPLRGGLTLVLAATVDCDAYLRAKATRPASAAGMDADGRNPLTGRRPQSLEQRQASSERMKALRAAQREAATAEPAG